MASTNTNLTSDSSAPLEGSPRGAATSPLRARFHSAGLMLFGLLGLFVAVRYFVGDATGLLFTLGVGAVLSVAAMVQVVRRVGPMSTDGSLYSGLLLGAIVGAGLLASGDPTDWVLSSLLISVALFAVVMARFEESALGVSVALSLAVLAAFVGASQLSTWVSWTLLSMSVMLLAAGVAISGERRART